MRRVKEIPEPEKKEAVEAVPEETKEETPEAPVFKESALNKCKECKGTGLENPDQLCSKCDGSGKK